MTRDYPEISVILITGNNEFEYARKAVKLGVCDYIVKPFEKEELILSLLKLQDNIGKAVESTEIKNEEHYDDLSYFSNVFKKYYGVSPRSMSREM